MSIPNIRLAFQGGGAKLAAMLPVADAFVEAQTQRLIKIDSVSGTSAGALCAALTAYKADFEKARQFVHDSGPALLTDLFPPKIQDLRERKLDHGKKLGFFDAFSIAGLVVDIILRGRPVLNQEALTGFVSGLLLASTGKGGRKIEDAPARLKIIASNIVKSEAVLHERGDLVEALIDSCALPVLLRSFDSLRESHHVDGGICDNLPVEGLLGNAEMPVFAIFPAPKSEAVDVSNIIKYLVALFSASINHGVNRSISMVSSPFRFEIETDLKLLDFKPAMKLLADDNWYEAEKAKAYSRIENFSKSFGVIATEHQARVLDVVNVEEYEKTIFNITKSSLDRFEVVRGRFMVRINSNKIFQNEKQAEARLSDTVTRTTQIRALEDGAPFYRANTAMDNDSIISTVWSAANITRKTEIPIRAVPVGQRKFNGRPVRYCLIEFLNAEAHISKDDIIEIQSVYHTPAIADMKKINLRQSDWFGFTNDQNKTVNIAELVLIYPLTLGPIDITPHPKRCSRPNDTKKMEFNREERAVLGEGFDICGLKLDHLTTNEALFCLATPH